MLWVALAATISLLALVGCGDTGASKQELHAAYERGYSAGEETGRNDAEAASEEEWDAGYEAGFGDGEKEALEISGEVEDEFEQEELEGTLESEEVRREAEEASQEAEEANEATEELEEEAERERRCEIYDYCYP